MNTYRFSFVDADGETAASTLTCHDDAGAMRHAETMLVFAGGVHVWRGADSLGIIFSKQKTVAAEIVRPVMHRSLGHGTFNPAPPERVD